MHPLFLSNGRVELFAAGGGGVSGSGCDGPSIRRSTDLREESTAGDELSHRPGILVQPERYGDRIENYYNLIFLSEILFRTGCWPASARQISEKVTAIA